MIAARITGASADSHASDAVVTCRYTFGVFCAMLVLCNFIIVCLYFPTVVAVRDRYFQHKRCCFCFCLCCRPRNSKVCMLDGGLCGRDDTGWQSSTHVHVR